MISGRQGAGAARAGPAVRDTDRVLAAARQTLDLDEPVAVMPIAMLHHVPDGDDPCAIAARLADAVATGRYLVPRHPASDVDVAAVTEVAVGRRRACGPSPGRWRTAGPPLSGGTALALGRERDLVLWLIWWPASLTVAMSGENVVLPGHGRTCACLPRTPALRNWTDLIRGRHDRKFPGGRTGPGAGGYRPG